MKISEDIYGVIFTCEKVVARKLVAIDGQATDGVRRTAERVKARVKAVWRGLISVGTFVWITSPRISIDHNMITPKALWFEL